MSISIFCMFLPVFLWSEMYVGVAVKFGYFLIDASSSWKFFSVIALPQPSPACGCLSAFLLEMVRDIC